MGLSYDLISEFVKITNDKKDDKKEGTVYATVVSGTEGKYVRIDGSDLLTPMDTTTDIEDGERVTLMIKDHKAIVTGNVTTPSASTTKVDKVSESVNSVSDRVGTFELIVADKVSTNELEAYKATIEVLIANKATIEDLTATNAKIENLEVKNAKIENLVAEKATIEDLEAVNATIENLKVKDAEIENAVVENLKATTADIKILNADFAQIKTLVNGNLTSDNILSFNLTSGKVTVDDAFIKDAMIDTISAGKINAGEINTNLVSIGSEDGGMLITGSTQQFTDKNGNVRIQIGKDASGDFTFVLYGEDGRGQLINQNGITASAIGDGLIVNDMVSDHAAISGGKLDISSVITEINSDNSTTIKSSKIYLNDQAQSLEVAFNSLKTRVDTIQEVTIQGDLTAIVEQVQSNTSKIEANKNSINTLISEDTVIKKQVTDLQGTLNETETTLNSKYTALSQNLDGFKTTVADTYATKKSVTDIVDNIETNYSTTSVMNSAIEQKAQEISASVSSTYATKNEVNTLDNNLRTNYSTTQQMESAINVAKEEINLGVSSIYETKENTTSKIQNAVNDIQVGGRNLLVGSDDGYLNDLTVCGLSGSISDLTSTIVDGWKRFNITTQLELKEIVHERYFIPRDLGVYTFSIECRTDATSFAIPRISLYNWNLGHFLISTKTIKISNNHYKITSTFDLTKGPTGYTLGMPIRIVDLLDVTTVGATYLEFRYPKVEKGNIASDWNRALEDITNDISTAKQEAITSANNTLTTTISNYYTKSQTDSQINVAKEAINLGVSSTYETKTNVETKVTSTLNSAKSYADTKKSEAISTASSDATSKANTAKQEAIASANNTLTSTIANYYTKSQTDSQINIAKEEINLGVSSIYETKESTTSKIQNAVNAVQIGGTNLWSETGWVDGALMADGTISDYWLRPHVYFPDFISIGNNRHITYQVWNPNGIINSDNYNRIAFYNSDKVFLSSYDIPRLNGESHQECTFEIPIESKYIRLGVISDISGGGYNDSLKFKFEFGNKATDWSPNLNDINSNISTAKQEAITSANNALTTTISNYYTKSQTDSQINVAKEAINLSVSNTYETKANVESKINNIQVGGRNLLVGSDDGYLNDLTVYELISDLTSTMVDGWKRFNITTQLELKEIVHERFFIPSDLGVYTFSIECRTDATAFAIPRMSLYTYSLGHFLISTKTIKISNNHYKITSTFDLTKGPTGYTLGMPIRMVDLMDVTTVGATYIEFRYPKVEKGNIASDWSQAPEDITSDISSIESETKSLKSTVTSLQLGTDSISASVKSLEESMVNTTNGLASDISKVQEQVNLAMTSSDVKIEIQKELADGVKKVSTSTGFTFDENGLSINKSDSEMNTQITEDGMKIYKNSEVMLTANNQGVDAKNLHATTYLIIGGRSRMEDFTENGSKRTAVFWIG